MSKILITMILSFCPGYDTDDKGQVVTTSCQEGMINCMVNKAGTNEPTEKEFNKCKNELSSKYGSSDKIPSTELKGF